MTSERPQRSKALSPAPLYSQLANIFCDLIRQKTWAVGVALPSEADLARTYGVSVGTTRKALLSLEENGWIKRQQGRGTHVSDPADRLAERFCRFFMMDGTGLYESATCELISHESQPFTAEQASTLSINDGEPSLQIARRFDAQDTPLMHEHLALRAKKFGDIDSSSSEAIRLYKELFYACAVTIEECRESISSVASSKSLSAELQLAPRSPLLRVQSRLIDSDGQAVGLIDRYVDGTRAEYRLALI